MSAPAANRKKEGRCTSKGRCPFGRDIDHTRTRVGGAQNGPPQWHRDSTRLDVFGKQRVLTLRELITDPNDRSWPNDAYYPHDCERGVFRLSLPRHRQLAQVTLGVRDFLPRSALSDDNLMCMCSRMVDTTRDAPRWLSLAMSLAGKRASNGFPSKHPSLRSW